MRYVLIGAAALAAVSLAGATPSSAQYWQGRGTWCIQPPIGGGTWSCYYYSQRQCYASTSYGTAGSCVPNPATEWVRRGEKIPPQSMPDYAKGRRTEREEGLRPIR